MTRALPASVLGLMLSACGVVYQDQVEEQSFPTSDTPKVLVDNVSGRLTVTPSTGNHVLATVIEHGTGATSEEVWESLEAFQVELRQEEDTITLTTRQEGDGPARAWADVELKVPAGATLELRTGSGDISTRGLSGALTLATTQGSIRVDGDSQHLVAETRNGRISLRSGRAARVEARTLNGEILYTGALAGDENLFATTSGNVTLALPPDSTFRLEAGTAAGQVQVDFPLVSERRGQEHVRGTVGHAPQADIAIRVTTGDISVRPEEGLHPLPGEVRPGARGGPGANVPEPLVEEVLAPRINP